MDNTGHEVPLNVGAQQHQGILDQTLGEVLKSNPQAQNMVMQAMHIGPDQFQKLLGMTGNNDLMNTKIRDLFSSGVVQQALAQQGQGQPAMVQNMPVSPDGSNQVVTIKPEDVPGGPQLIKEEKKPSFMDKLKHMFKIM